MSNSVYQLYDFVNSGGTINKVSQSAGGIYKVPFAIDAKGEDVSQEKAKKYYLSCRAIDDKLKLLKNKKRVYSTFFGQIFYFIEIKEQLKSILSTLEGIFSIHVSVFLDWPQPYFCPDCKGEVLFDYRKANGYSVERTYFSHKVIFCLFSEETIETIKNRSIVDSYKVEALNSFINTGFTKEIFLQKLRELKGVIGKIEYKFQEDEIERIFCNVPKKTSETCDFLQETEKHFRAKCSVVKAINEDREIFLLRRCSKCKKIGKQFFPVKHRQASIEYILPAGQRADVAILDENNNLTAVIEIIDDNRVDEEKAKALEGIPWGEFSAETILGGKGWLVKRDNFKPYVCKDCKNAQVEEIFPQICTGTPPASTGATVSRHPAPLSATRSKAPRPSPHRSEVPMSRRPYGIPQVQGLGAQPLLLSCRMGLASPWKGCIAWSTRLPALTSCRPPSSTPPLPARLILSFPP